jgi:hypothetical protein
MPPTLNVCKRHKLKSAENIKPKPWLARLGLWSVCYIPNFRGTMYFKGTIPNGPKIKNKGECKQRTSHQQSVLGQVPTMTCFIHVIFAFYLFNDASAAQTIEVRTVWSLVKNSKTYERKWSWPNLRYCLQICLGILTKAKQNAIKTVGVPA